MLQKYTSYDIHLSGNVKPKLHRFACATSHIKLSKYVSTFGTRISVCLGKNMGGGVKLWIGTSILKCYNITTTKKFRKEFIFGLNNNQSYSDIYSPIISYSPAQSASRNNLPPPSQPLRAFVGKQNMLKLFSSRL